MKELLRSKPGKLACRGILISLAFVIIGNIIFRLTILALDNSHAKGIDSTLEFFFTIGYVLIYVAVFLFLISAITLIVLFIKKWRKNRLKTN